MNTTQTKTILRSLIPPVAALAIALLPAAGLAEIRNLGAGVDLHYNALASTDIPAQVMKSYNLKRSKKLGLLNISLVETSEDPMGGPPLRKGIEADSISCTATTLSNQQRELEVSTVTSGEAVYHLAQFPIENEDKIQFSCTLDVPASAGNGGLAEEDREGIELDFSKSFHP